VDGLKHGIMLSYIGTSCGAHTSLQLRRLIGQDISVKVGQYHHLELFSSFFVYKFSCHDVYIPVIGLDLGIISGYIFTDIQEFSVGGFHNIGFCYNGDSFLSVFFCIIKGHTGDPFGALGGYYSEVNSQVFGYVNALRSHCIKAFCVLTEKSPVYAFFRYLYGTNIGKKIQCLSHGHICTFHIGPFISFTGSGCGTFEKHIAFLYFVQDIIGDGLAFGGTVFYGKTLDCPKFYFALFYFFRKEGREHFLCMGRYGGADTVTSDNTNDCFFKRAVIRKTAVFFHFLDP